MAHHQQTNHDRIYSASGHPPLNGSNGPGAKMLTGDEETAADVDEPPDLPIRFSKHGPKTESIDYSLIPTLQSRRASLLTQALHTSPELTPLSDAEAPMLTSDGGMTSPTRSTTPSPPLPPSNFADLADLEAKDKKFSSPAPNTETVPVSSSPSMDKNPETKVEKGLGRRRCITFACGRNALSQKKDDQSGKTEGAVKDAAEILTSQPRRPCLLKFAASVKLPRRDLPRDEVGEKFGEPLQRAQLPTKSRDKLPTTSGYPTPKNLDAFSKDAMGKVVPPLPTVDVSCTSKAFNRIDFQKSESTRFHEFGSTFANDDEWTNEQTAYRQKMTINDTLRKENAIRRLAEEAEQEALDEDEDDAIGEDDSEDDVDDDDDDDISDINDKIDVSDGGNESDDEEGFADSDDESEAGSGYQFWTPGLTTAATSTDHIDHIRPLSQRAASESSIESIIERSEPRPSDANSRREKRPNPRKTQLIHPELSNLPDSSDFVVGTLDEDRPLEEAYMSHLEERRRSKRKLIPQDIDPSFPLDSEAEDDDDGDDDEVAGAASVPEQETKLHEWIIGRSDGSEEEPNVPGRRDNAEKASKVSTPSPKRLHSHPPQRLFGQATHRLRSPPPLHRKLASPPSSRRPSPSGSLPRQRGINMPRLAQRPNLTHTTSLPRTPNPFWYQHRKSRLGGIGSPSSGVSETHSRGPIDIVQGLENKRLRRKEKYWRIHCRNAHAGKEKDRKCQPGKGAERMREVGLEMADRCRGYGQKINLMLSV